MAFLSFGTVPVAAAAGTCTDSWAAGVNGVWATPGNWSTGTVPTSTDDVCLGDVAGGSYTVTLDGAASVHSVTIGGTLNGTQALMLQGDAAGNALLSLGTGASTVNPNGAMTLFATSGASSATVAGSGTLVNQGSFSTVQGGGGTRYLRVPLTNSGTVTVSASDTRQDAATLTTNNGTFTVDPGNTLALTGGGSFANASGSLTVNGSFAEAGGTFTQLGGTIAGANPPVLTDVAMTDSAGSGRFVLRHQNSLSGTIPPGQTITVLGDAAGNGTLNLLGGTLTNAGMLRFDAAGGNASTTILNGTLDNGATVQMVQGGGVRSIEAAVVNEAGATVEIAASDTRQDSATLTTNRGTLKLDAGAHLVLAPSAGLTETPTASISLAIDAVTGASTITGGTIINDGNLHLETSGPPAVGTTYPAISGAARSGMFRSVQSLGAGYGVSYTPNAVVLVVGPAPALAVSPASPQMFGTALGLTATITPTDATGTVQFVADGATSLGGRIPVSGGTASATTSNLAVGAHTLTAVFTPGDETQYAASTSDQMSYTIQQDQGAQTQTGLAVDSGTAAGNGAVTFTATVSPSGVRGTVTLQDLPTGTTIGTTAADRGTFVLETSALGQGQHNITAIFNPADPTIYNSSMSPPVMFNLGPPARSGAQAAGAAAPAGSLTITTPYTPASPLCLGMLTLNSAATMFSATTTFQSIVITDNRSGSLPITATAQSSDLTSGANVINSQNVGLTSLVVVPLPGNGIQAAQVTTFDNPAADPAVAPDATGSTGLGGGVAHTIATVNSGPGSFSMNGTLTLTAPSSTPGATDYTGTITFTVG